MTLWWVSYLLNQLEVVGYVTTQRKFRCVSFIWTSKRPKIQQRRKLASLSYSLSSVCVCTGSNLAPLQKATHYFKYQRRSYRMIGGSNPTSPRPHLASYYTTILKEGLSSAGKNVLTCSIFNVNFENFQQQNSILLFWVGPYGPLETHFNPHCEITGFRLRSALACKHN